MLKMLHAIKKIIPDMKASTYTTLVRKKNLTRNYMGQTGPLLPKTQSGTLTSHD